MRFRVRRGIVARYKPPPSKSYTHRALVAASLATGESTIVNPSICDDTVATIGCLRRLGVDLVLNKPGEMVVKPPDELKTPDDVLNCGESGTTIRFLTSLCSLTPSGYCVLTGGESLRRRPLGPLLNALRDLGVEAFSTRGNGLPPVVVKGGGMAGGQTGIDASLSSQFVSSILLAAPRSVNGVEMVVENPVSKTYIDSTIRTMLEFGVRVKRRGYDVFEVEGGAGYKPTRFTVPGDFSSAVYPICLVAMTGGELVVGNVMSTLPQADEQILNVLSGMGVKVFRRGGDVVIESSGEIDGGVFDLRDSPDLLPAVAVLGLKSKSPVVIKGVGHTRLKESDRVSSLATELRRIGSRVVEGSDYLIVHPVESPLRVLLDPHNDHRIFMALAVASAAFNGVFGVKESECYKKSYPSFISDLAKLGVEIY